MRYKHIVIPTVGGPENLNLVEDELPEPRANEVRVKVLAAGVSFADILMRKGVHPESWNLARTPFTPGWDVVGVVDKLGDGVSKWQTGQMVAALPIVGGYAEYIILPSNELVPVPSRLDHAEAVSLILNYTTAYQMLHRCAHIKPGEIILINGGAAGGVGTALLQLGKLASLKKMYGTATYDKHDIVSSLGGIPIDYKSVDLVQEITKLTSHHDGDDDMAESGVDVVFDGVGGKSLKSSYEMLRSGGRLVAYGGTPTSDLGDWLMMFTSNLVPDKREFMLYSIQTLKRVKPDWFHEDLILLLNLLKQGKIKPIVAERMPLNQAVQAHELLASGSVTGTLFQRRGIEKANFMISPGASFFSLYGDGIKDRYEDCLKAQGLIRMPCEISIELRGSFSTTIDWILQERKKILLSYYKPDNEGKRFKQVSSCKI